MGFPRRKYWSDLPFPPLGDHPDTGIEPTSPALAGGLFTTEPPGKPNKENRVGQTQPSVKVKIKQGGGTRSKRARLTFKHGNQTGDL